MAEKLILITLYQIIMLRHTVHVMFMSYNFVYDKNIAEPMQGVECSQSMDWFFYNIKIADAGSRMFPKYELQLYTMSTTANIYKSNTILKTTVNEYTNIVESFGFCQRFYMAEVRHL